MTSFLLLAKSFSNSTASSSASTKSSARALLPLEFSAEEIARRAMKIAAGICVFTNENVTIETLSFEDGRRAS